MTRLTAILCSALLLLPLVLPQGLALLGVSEGPGAVEKGVKATLPPLSMLTRDFKGWAKALVSGYAEGFPFREAMIRAGNVLRMAVFGQSPVKSVILGREGWLFFTQEMNLEDWLGVDLYSPEELDAAVRTLTARRDWLGARGMRMLLVVAPGKMSIYGEFLPPSFHRLAPQTRLDQLARAMRDAGLPFLDLRPALLAAKGVRRAYWYTDTHWNGWGALAGSMAIVDRLRENFPSMPPLRAEDYAVVQWDARGGDLAEMLFLENSVREPMIEMAPRTPNRARVAQPRGYVNPATLSGRDMVILETPDPALPRAVFFRDSFASSAVPFLAERFSRSVFLWTHAFQPAIVLAEKPDVVVFEAVERYQHALFLSPDAPYPTE